jgi:hypothetical protein
LAPKFLLYNPKILNYYKKMSIKEHVFRYFNLLDMKKRFGIKNKYIHFLIMHRLLNEMPIVVKDTVSTERMMKYLCERYGYNKKCEAIKEIEKDLLTNYIDNIKGKKFDEIGFKIFCALIRKNFVIRLGLEKCSLDDYKLLGLLIVDFTKLRDLNLSHNEKISDYSIRILEECPTMINLKDLNISETGISSKGIFKITQSVHFSNLMDLNIRFRKMINEIDPKWFKTMKSAMKIWINVESYKKCDDEKMNEKFNDSASFQIKTRKTSSNKAIK